MKRIEKKVFNDLGDWVGMEITETMTIAEAQERYPHIAIVDLSKLPPK